MSYSSICSSCNISQPQTEWFLFVYNERAAGFLFVHFYCVYNFSKSSPSTNQPGIDFTQEVPLWYDLLRLDIDVVYLE